MEKNSQLYVEISSSRNQPPLQKKKQARLLKIYLILKLTLYMFVGVYEFTLIIYFFKVNNPK